MRDPIHPEAVRDFLAAVLEALNIPHPATIGDSEQHARLLADRVMHAVIALQHTIDGHPLGIEWTTEYLREQLAAVPPVGYRGYGASRTEAGQ